MRAAVIASAWGALAGGAPCASIAAIDAVEAMSGAPNNRVCTIQRARMLRLE